MHALTLQQVLLCQQGFVALSMNATKTPVCPAHFVRFCLQYRCNRSQAFEEQPALGKTGPRDAGHLVLPAAAPSRAASNCNRAAEQPMVVHSTGQGSTNVFNSWAPSAPPKAPVAPSNEQSQAPPTVIWHASWSPHGCTSSGFWQTHGPGLNQGLLAACPHRLFRLPALQRAKYFQSPEEEEACIRWDAVDLHHRTGEWISM